MKNVTKLFPSFAFPSCFLLDFNFYTPDTGERLAELIFVTK